jgi:hypothetical protein
MAASLLPLPFPATDGAASFAQGWDLTMNLPLPSASTSVAPDTTRYGPVAAASSRTDTRDDGTNFADMLAGAALSADSPPFQHSAGASRPPAKINGQVPAIQAPIGSEMKQAEPARRSRLKTDKSDNASAAAQGNAGAALLISLPAADAEPLQAQTANSAPAGECDKGPSPGEVADSSRQLPQFPVDLHPIQWAASGNLTDPNGADPRSGAEGALSVTDAIDNPAASAFAGFTDTDLKPGPALASPRVPANPVDPGMPQAASRHPAESTHPGPSNINQGDPVAVPSGGSSATLMGSSSNWAENIAPPSMPPTHKEAPGGRSTPPDTASDARLDPDSQQVNLSSHSVGIASAKQSTEMRKPTDTSVPVRFDRASGLEVSASTTVSSAFSSAPTTALATRVIAEPASSSVSHAAAAVEATLDAVEHMSDTAHSSVELKLSFSDDAHLAVRVELRNGEVQTTFRTDSTELRQALTNEWRQQAPTVMTTASDRPVRIADPVFAPASGSLESAGTFTGGHADSHQPSAPAPAESSFPTSPRPQSRASAASSPPSGPSRLPTSLRLNVFA